MKVNKKIRVLVVGVGNMGASHARAYFANERFELIGIVARTKGKREILAKELGAVPEFSDFDDALMTTRPDAVAICTYPDTHKDFAVKSIRSGAHVFLEKPLATTVKDAEEVVAVAQKYQKKLVVGYILRHHPSWIKFTELAQELGKPLVMRMNLNQQSSGNLWMTHQHLMKSMSPIVDCGVHYVDIMCQMTRSKPTSVHAIGARLSDEIDDQMYNYGQLQVQFEDGSVGWYEAAWGPMVSETAYFVKDVIGPRGSVSILDRSMDKSTSSAEIDGHTKTNQLLVHFAERNEKGAFARKDKIIDTTDEPDHQELCNREQSFFQKAIEEDLDLSDHLEDAINSLRIVLAADESVRKGGVVKL